MRLGLLGYPITHSLSPKLYKEILGPELSSYTLFSYENKESIPSLEEFASKLDGLNITSPYKTHFINQVEVPSSIVKKIGALNTLSFTPAGVLGTNTDLLAVEEVLRRYKQECGQLHLLILGSGVMAQMTEHVAQELDITWNSFSRKIDGNISKLDLLPYRKSNKQNIVVNACSRNYTFEGRVSSDDIFWDYNYAFLPHQNTLPTKVKLYQDGQEMLTLQALAAVKFWHQTNPKLK